MNEAFFITINLSVWLAFMVALSWPLVHMLRTGRDEGAVVFFYIIAVLVSQVFVGLGWFIVVFEFVFAVAWVGARSLKRM